MTQRGTIFGDDDHAAAILDRVVISRLTRTGDCAPDIISAIRVRSTPPTPGKLSE